MVGLSSKLKNNNKPEAILKGECCGQNFPWRATLQKILNGVLQAADSFCLKEDPSEMYFST